MRVYQPVSSYKPVVVDTRAANFDDVSLTVRCPQGNMLTPAETRVLCARVTRLFETQGATVRTAERGVVDDPLDPGQAVVAATPRTDLTLEVRARKLHESRHPLSWMSSFVTYTLLPALHEVTFAHDVTVRDGDGFVLATDSIQGRLLTRFGLGSWTATRLTDLTIRDRDQRLIGSVTRDLSSHVYGRISQVAFNAKLQREVLLANPASVRR